MRDLAVRDHELHLGAGEAQVVGGVLDGERQALLEREARTSPFWAFWPRGRLMQVQARTSVHGRRYVTGPLHQVFQTGLDGREKLATRAHACCPGARDRP